MWRHMLVYMAREIGRWALLIVVAITGGTLLASIFAAALYAAVKVVGEREYAWVLYWVLYTATVCALFDYGRIQVRRWEERWEI